MATPTFNVGDKAYLAAGVPRINMRKGTQLTAEIWKTVERSTFDAAGNYLVGTVAWAGNVSKSDGGQWVGFKFKSAPSMVFVLNTGLSKKAPAANAATPEAKRLQALWQKDNYTLAALTEAADMLVQVKDKLPTAAAVETQLAALINSVSARQKETAKFLGATIDGVEGLGFVPAAAAAARLAPLLPLAGKALQLGWKFVGGWTGVIVTSVVIGSGYAASKVVEWLNKAEPQAEIDRRAANGLKEKLAALGVKVTPEVEKAIDDSLKEHGEESRKAGGKENPGMFGNLAEAMKYGFFAFAVWGGVQLFTSKSKK